MPLVPYTSTNFMYGAVRAEMVIVPLARPPSHRDQLGQLAGVGRVGRHGDPTERSDVTGKGLLQVQQVGQEVGEHPAGQAPGPMRPGASGQGALLRRDTVVVRHVNHVADGAVGQ